MSWQKEQKDYVIGIVQGTVPSKSNGYKIIKIGNHASLGKTATLQNYEKSFFMQCKDRGKNIDSYFEFQLDVYYPSNRSDLDNSLKIILDCLQKANVIKNDNLCTQILARKFVDKNNPRIEYKINPVAGFGT